MQANEAELPAVPMALLVVLAAEFMAFEAVLIAFEMALPKSADTPGCVASTPITSTGSSLAARILHKAICSVMSRKRGQRKGKQ